MLNVSEAAVAVHGVDLVWSEQRVDTTLMFYLDRRISDLTT